MLYLTELPCCQGQDSNLRPIDPEATIASLLWKHIISHWLTILRGYSETLIRSAALFCNCVINDDKTKVKRMCALFLRIRFFFLLFQKIAWMPVNKNALIRYRTIDSCLRNRRRKWTLHDLINAVGDALYEYEGIHKGISRRAIQMDLQAMRSDKLGYSAPIIVVDKKYYTYEDPEYSITNIPLSEVDLSRMNEAVEVLKQFKGFSHFSSLNEVIHKLEDHVYAASNNTRSVIEFEKNERLKGLEHLEMLYQSVIQKKPVRIAYQSFKAKSGNSFDYHVWWLKEFKNRWFAVGVKGAGLILTHLALDRIVELELLDGPLYIENDDLDPQDYYKHVIGVTVANNLRTQHVKILVSHEHAPYILTKPMHHTQELLETGEEGVIIHLKVQLNFELEREILGYGDGMTVLTPHSLRDRIHKKFMRGVQNYGDPGTIPQI
jgi:predicted DNA-binding transcriptional regulator YafY